MALQIRKAERRKVPIKIAITGPSGSGKTYSSLKLAYGLAGPEARVLLVDTENGSGDLYSGHFPEYDVCPIEAPYTTEKYEEAIRLAVQHRYDVLIIDSLTHAWAGTGGLLEQKEALDKRGGNRFANWSIITERHENLKRAMLESPLHVIATMRSKQEYAQDEQTKKVTKLGMAPIQRDGMEYEFTVVFDVASDHSALASKDRTSLFNGLTARLTEEHGRMIREWLESGAPVPVSAPTPQPASRPVSTSAPTPQNGHSNGNGRARAEAAVKAAERPLTTVTGQTCPDCHAPAGKPHTRRCPQAQATAPAPPSAEPPAWDAELRETPKPTTTLLPDEDPFQDE